MSRWITAGVFLLAAAGVLWMPPQARPVPAPKAPVAEAGGACGCRSGLRCCLDCNGNVLCVRSIAQCPECPAP
jgi:hypothetical protein